MSQHSPRKSLRAAATRRRAPIIDDSDDEENQAPHIKQEDEEEFTPKPAPAKRGRGRPKKVVDEAATPKVSTRRRLRATESLEPTQVFTPASEDPEPLSPTKKPVRKRAGARPSRRERLSAASSSVVSPSVDSPSVDGPSVDEASVDEASVDGSSRLPTPQATQSPEPAVKPEPEPEPTNVPGTPLADITNSALNDRTPVPESRTLRVKSKTPESDSEMSQHAAVERVNVHHTVMERPMDIVVRKRAAGIPMTQEHQTPKQRTVITWLVLTNFKSYAGEQRVGPFHASFSSVVGPNGSGKSNVIDSLLFVFGFRASKMRQGKISALIHNSAAFPNLEYCEVEVHFQEVKDLPTGGSEVVPDSQLVISRRAFKNNSSKYYINNKESTFTVVTNLLKDRGVDLDHKRFLILQGEVESIAQMKPKAANEHDDGLLEYLEDIIGTSKYKTPIEEWAAKTEELNEICMEKNSRVQHVEKERSGMEEMKNKALEFIRDENELATKQSALYQIYISDLNDHIQVAEESVGQMQARLDEELQKHQGSEEAYKQLERQHKKATQDHERLEKQAQELQKDVAKVKKETISLEEKKKYLANKLKKHEKTKETSQYGISEATTLARQYADDMERYDMEIAELEESKKVEEAELEKIRANLSGKTQSLSDEIAAKQKSLEPWNAKINEKQSAMAVAQSELDILREKENAGAKGIAELEARIVGFEESKETKAAELQECTAAKKGAEKELGKLRAQLEQLSQKEPALKTKLSGARQKADEARASLSATQTQGNVLTGLMRLKESGRIDGFHGRLGNLGAINQKYDVAISTACPQLNNLVVDSVEVGQQCIDYLRKNNLGRANFILLDRLPKRDLSQIPTPENVPRLFDLVKPKHDRFLPAFFSVLQNTLVASDLQQANRIAYGAQRWRVVTLDGQLIDKSGTMSGGGTRVAKGGMSSKLASDVSKDQVAKLEQDRDDLEKTFGKLQQEQRDLEATIRELTKKIPELENKAELIELELRSFDGQISDANRRIKELSAEQSSTKSDKSRISTLEKSIGSTEKEISKLRAETAGVEAEIKALQDKIMEIGGVKLRGQKAKVDGLKQQIDTVTEARLSAEGSKSKEEKNRVKHEKAHATAVKELEKVAKDAAKVEADMEAHKHNAAGIGEQAEEALEVCPCCDQDDIQLTHIRP